MVVMDFSERTSHPNAPNALTTALDAARARQKARGEAFFDLTVSNPTTAGITYDGGVLPALAHAGAAVYAPEPLGLLSARAAVAAHVGASGTSVDATRIAITASTSEAYAALFKIFCDPGDEILVPSPSYPLLEYLAAFECVNLKPYPLVYAGGWHVDLEGLKSAVGPRTRAIVVVAPNNPTGSYLGAEELEAMLDTGLPIVSDEVFAEYPLGTLPEGRVRSVLGAQRGLVVALSGLSKSAALPQLKLGWIAAAGDAKNVDRLMARLELVLDAYLSVGAPVQHALPSLLSSAHVARDHVRTRTRKNLATVREVLARAPTATMLPVEAGWYATLRVPETRSDEAWAIELLERDGVYVHPGYFFDMRGAHLVVSLLTPENTLAEGIRRVAERIAAEHE